MKPLTRRKVAPTTTAQTASVDDGPKTTAAASDPRVDANSGGGAIEKKQTDIPDALLGSVEFTRRADELIGAIKNWLRRMDGQEETPERVSSLAHNLIEERLNQ